MAWPGIGTVQQHILYRRRILNRNNLSRTAYYLNFWRRNPDIPWALIAHLVSRNAGYQMTDLERFYQWKVRSSVLSPPTILDVLAPAQIIALFAFLETGNFLIFRDVQPQLDAYETAKRYPQHANEIFEMLLRAEFDADLFIVAETLAFWSAASQANWFVNWWSTPSALQTVQRHTFALVSNEQNQIEDRLVNFRENWRYLGPFGPSSEAVIELVNMLGLTRLCFPQEPSASDQQLRLLIYRVRNFLDLESRIDTGRNLFVGLFTQGNTRRTRMEQWATQHAHNASRVDYNDEDYDTDPSALFPGGDTYSPRLFHAWPASPGATLRYKHLHQPPIKLPISVTDRPKYSDWLKPPTNPQPLTSHLPSEQAEIFI